jgi:AraC-like DNA-binding protein
METTTEFWRDPALPYAESRRACHSRACYIPHSHPTFSIGAVDEGASVFTGAGDSPVALRPGTLVFVPAHRVHACNPAPDAAWSYQMLHLDSAWLQAVRQEYGGPSTTCGKDEAIRIVCTPAVYAHFCSLMALLFYGSDPQDKEAALIEFIGTCDEADGLRVATRATSPCRAGALGPVLDFLRNTPVPNAALVDLASLAGMSRYQLIRTFRAVTGMTPHAWQLNQRVNLARARLRAGEDIAQVAHGLGFADQAHFQRVFKAHAGITPGRYRA